MTDIAIIGGGLAGLTAAVHLVQAGKSVRLIEKKQFPQHKVCGEYISAEVLPYFESLGIQLHTIQPDLVRRFRLHAPSGHYVETLLPLGGIGIRRYTLDNHLYQYAQLLGVLFELNTQIDQVTLEDDRFILSTKKALSFEAKVVLASFGKRSNLDLKLKRPFVQNPAAYVGVKFYINNNFPSDLVSLYNFTEGYAGAVRVEDGSADIAYLCQAKQLQKYGSIEALEHEVLYKNPAIKNLFNGGKRSPEKPIAISNVSFLPKRQVEQHMLMIGDAAGMIPPLAGNGMAMGIHGAKIAAECSLAFLNEHSDRFLLEKQFTQAWQAQFNKRLFWGRRLHKVMGKPLISEFAVRTLIQIPALLPPIIKQTHGKPIKA
ncbi:MAG: NAD(P)/FAD-dependent oxidoreductase [Bacteroidota bacterium]